MRVAAASTQVARLAYAQPCVLGLRYRGSCVQLNPLSRPCRLGSANDRGRRLLKLGSADVCTQFCLFMYVHSL